MTYISKFKDILKKRQRIEKKIYYFLALNCQYRLLLHKKFFILDRDMYEAHDAYICVGEKTYVNEKNRLKYSSEHYLKSSEDMKKLFKDLPDALINNYNL